MSKKSFKGGFDSLLGETKNIQPAFIDDQSTSDINFNKKNTSTKEKTKITIRIESTLLENMKEVAYWNKHNLTQAIEIAIRDWVEKTGKKSI